MKKLYEVPEFDLIIFSIKTSVLDASPTVPYPSDTPIPSASEGVDPPVGPPGPRQ